MKAIRFSQFSGMLAAGCIVAAGFVMLVPNAFAETTLQRIQRTGEVRIGYANEAPFAYTAPDGTVTGESPEIAKKVFAKLGVKKVDAVLTEWGSLIPGLKAGRFDVIAAGMYITPERCKTRFKTHCSCKKATRRSCKATRTSRNCPTQSSRSCPAPSKWATRNKKA